MNKIQIKKQNNYSIISRLDDAIPLVTKEWQKVEHNLNKLSEFVPQDMLNELSESIILYADDQARRGYLLGQDDLIVEMRQLLGKSD